MIRLFILYAIVSPFACLCPDNSVVTPCKCLDNTIACINTTKEFDLKAFFTKINANLENGKKNFKGLVLEKTQVKELDANVFGDLTFEKIDLLSNPILTYIHPLAFIRSSFHLRIFNSEYTPLSNAYPKERDIFDALSRCPDLEMVRLYATNLTSIPDKAFHPINGDFTKLTTIYTNESPIETIGEFAFYYMPNLSWIRMTKNKFKVIKKNTFTIRDHSNKKAEIYLQEVPLTENSFDPLSFVRVRRPLWIRLFYNNMTTIPESVFAPFLELYDENWLHVDTGNDELKCDCRLKWISDEREYYRKNFKKIGGVLEIDRCNPTNC